jgi:hypothetical protein
MAAKQALPEYARHLDWCRSCWRRRTGRDDYIPAITGAIYGGSEYADWEAANIMERRAALRALPDIAALIRAGTGQQ